MVKALLQIVDKNEEDNFFERRYELIVMWIKNKWINYGVKAKLFEFKHLTAVLKKLVAMIANKKNRLLAFTSKN